MRLDRFQRRYAQNPKRPPGREGCIPATVVRWLPLETRSPEPRLLGGEVTDWLKAMVCQAFSSLAVFFCLAYDDACGGTPRPCRERQRWAACVHRGSIAGLATGEMR